MAKELLLLTPLSAFEELHRLVDEKRAAAVMIEREALSKLLVDHSALVTACKGAGIKIVEPTPKRGRIVLKP